MPGFHLLEGGRLKDMLHQKRFKKPNTASHSVNINNSVKQCHVNRLTITILTVITITPHSLNPQVQKKSTHVQLCIGKSLAQEGRTIQRSHVILPCIPIISHSSLFPPALLRCHNELIMSHQQLIQKEHGHLLNWSIQKNTLWQQRAQATSQSQSM